MIYDFHTHTFLSDGLNSPIELIRCADSCGYSCIALTDHASYSNIDFIVESVAKDCDLAMKYWDIIAVPGVELTNVPAKSIDDMAKYAREKGARIVIVHGESIVEPVAKETNWAAVNSKYVDVLAHPGLITLKEAETAARNNIYIEITHRTGHCLSNGLVAKIGTQAGVKFLVNSDAHSHQDLYREDHQKMVARAAGLENEHIKEIFAKNCKDFLKKLGY